MSTKLDNYKKKNMRNKHFMSKMKTEKNKYLSGIKTGDANTPKLMNILERTIQKIKSKGILHKKKASRLISRLAKKQNLAV